MEKIDGLGDGDVLVLAGSIPIPCRMTCISGSWSGFKAEESLTAVVDATRDLLVKVLPYHPFLVETKQL